METNTSIQDPVYGMKIPTDGLLDQVSFEPGMKLKDIEKAVILETLKRQNFNRTRAARVLGIGIRTLQRKLKQYRIDASMSVLADA